LQESKANHWGVKAEPERFSCCSCCTGASLVGFWFRRWTNKYTMPKIMIARAMMMILGPKRRCGGTNTVTSMPESDG
jgi:hypothetical protein